MIKSKERKRSIDLESLSENDLAIITEDLSAKLRTISDKACLQANKLVKNYGVKVVMQFLIEPLTKPSK